MAGTGGDDVGAAPVAAPRTLVVGSTNPVKTEAVRTAFAKCFPETTFEVFSVKAASGVSDQPMDDHETRQGAINRARAAVVAFGEEHDGAVPDFCVGLEGGVCEDEFKSEASGCLICFAWMAAYHPRTDKWGFARTASMMLPPVVSDLIRGGMELGHADDKVFGRTNSKQKDGSVGLFSKGLINRAAYYDHALVLALVPFMNVDLFGYADEAGDRSATGAASATDASSATAGDSDVVDA